MKKYWKYLRFLLPVFVIFTLVIGFNAVSAYAATTADVTITATPKYITISISNSPNTWAIGSVDVDTAYWWTTNGSAPAEPFVDGDMKETLTNGGSIAIDVDIHGHTFTGGVGWTLSTDATPAENEISVRAGITGTANEAGMIQVITTDTELISNLASSGTKKICLEAKTGTFTDGVGKSGTVTYTGRAVS